MRKTLTFGLGSWLAYIIRWLSSGTLSKTIIDSRPWLIPVLLGAILRLANLGGESFWYDEAYTLWIAKLPLDRMMGAITGDVHPPLFYWLQWFNVRILGESEWALRLPSVIFGVMAVYLITRIAVDCTHDNRVGFASGLIASCLPGLLYYSQEGRMYSLLVMFVAVALLGAIEFKPWLFALGGIGAIYSQNLGVVFIWTIGSVWFGIELRGYLFSLFDLPGGGYDGGRIRAILFALAAILLAWIPWFPTLAHQIAQIQKGYWIQPINIGAVLLPIPVIGWGWRYPDSLQITVYSFSFAILLVGLIVSRSWLTQERGRLLMAGAFLAPMLAAVYSLFRQSIYLPRAMLPALVLLIPIMAYPLVRMTQLNRVIALLLAIPCLGAGVYFHYFPAIGGRFPAREWGNTINQGWQEGDIVYHMGIDTAMIFKPYLAYPDYAVLPHFSDLNQALTEETKSFMGFNQVPFDDLRGKGYSRAWLVVTENRITNTTQMSEVERILKAYPHSLARQIDDGFLNESIYLVIL